MAIILHINNEHCTSVDQLKEYFSIELAPDNDIYADLLDYGRHGDIAKWLLERGEADLASCVDSIDTSLTNSAFYGQLKAAIIGLKVSGPDIAKLKPTFEKCFSFEDIKFDDNDKYVNIRVSFKVLMCANEEYELRVSCSWGIHAIMVNPYSQAEGKTVSFDFAFHKCPSKDFGEITVMSDGKELFRTFNYVSEFNEGFAKVKLNEHECGYINRDGQVIIKIECGFLDAQDFSEGYAAVKKDGRWGYIDSMGKVVVDYQFVDAGPFKLGLAPVKVANTRKVDIYCSKELAHQWGYIDTTGKIVIPPKYDDATPFSLKWGVARVGIMRYTNLICGFINSVGQVVIPIEHERLSSMSDEGLACLDVNQDGDKGFINYKGNRTFYTSFNMVGSFSEGYCAVRNNDYKWGFIDKTGNLVIGYKYDYANRFSDGMSDIKIGDKHGFINKQGIQIIEPKYQNVRYFSEGVAGFEINNKWGIIDLLGNIIVNPIYDCVFGCHDGLIPVMQKVANKDVWFYIHKDGIKKLIVRNENNTLYQW